MKRKYFILCLCSVPLLMHAQLTVQKGAGLYLHEKALLTIQGDLESGENIGGSGSILLNGNLLQSISTDNNDLPALVIENRYGAVLNSPLRINQSIILQSGHLQLNKYDLELGNKAMAAGNASAYIETDDEGKVIKSVQRDLDGFMLPIGTKNNYAPLLLRSSGNYRGGKVKVASKDKASPDKPLSSRDYLENYWTIERKGINGDLIVTAFYNKVSGNEGNIHPHYWNGMSWIGKDGPVDIRNKLLSLAVPEGSGQIYAMRKGDEPAPGNSSMTLLPNPVKNMATLVIRSSKDDKGTVHITDNSGTVVISQRVFLRTGLNQVNINVMSLASGHYTVSSTVKNVPAIKMIKQ